jgi:hypothetical protein
MTDNEESEDEYRLRLLDRLKTGHVKRLAEISGEIKRLQEEEKEYIARLRVIKDSQETVKKRLGLA